jgi:hypothetical protein
MPAKKLRNQTKDVPKMLFTFNKGEIVSEATSVYHMNLDCIAFLQEVAPDTEFPSRWFVSRNVGGWFVTEEAFARLKHVMESHDGI